MTPRPGRPLLAAVVCVWAPRLPLSGSQGARTLRPSGGLGCPAASGDRDLARSDHLDQAEGADQLFEGGDLAVRAGDLDGYRALRDVHGLAAEDVRVLHDLGAGVAVLARDLEQRQLAGDGVARLQVADLDHVHQLVE